MAEDSISTSASPPRPSETLFYLGAAAFGILAGWIEVQIGDLLFTALLALAPCILLGALRPHKPWRWALLVGAFVPIADLLAFLWMKQKPSRAQIYESFLVFLPAIVGAYGGSFMRGVIENISAAK